MQTDMLLMFIFAFLGLMIMLRVHGKTLIELITPKKKINFRKILFGFTVWLLIAVVLEVVVYLINPEGYLFEFKPLSFIILLLISIVILPIQTSFEELFFRGYIMQGAVNFYPYKWFGLLVSTLFFAFVHGANPEVSEYGVTPMMIYYLIAGLFFGVITILDNSLELALGLHWATNLFGALFLSYKGSVLQTDSLFKSDLVNPWIMCAFFIVAALIFIYICWNKYNWTFPSFRMVFGEVEFNEEMDVIVEPKLVDDGLENTIGINYKSLFNNGIDEEGKEENT